MTNNEQNTKKINPSPSPEGDRVNRDVLKWIIIGLLAVVVIILVLGVGIFIGEKKAKFSYRWAESYHKNFAGPRGGFLGDWRSFPRGDFIEGHGAFGEIIELQDKSFVIKGRGDVEKVIVVTDKTVIQKGRETVKKENLKVGNQVVIIGSPNEEGQIEAKLIRLFNGEDTKRLQRRSWFPFFR